MLLDEFTGARLKLGRAKAHVSELGSMIAQLARDHPISIRVGPAEGKWVPYAADFTAPDTGPLSLVAADAIQNLRATLDLGASALARKNGVTSNAKLAKVFFPMGSDAADWVKRCKELGTQIGTRAQQAIEALEAYPGGAGGRLKALTKLSNIDKHRLLVPTVPVTPADVGFGFNKQDLDGTPAKAEMQVGPLMGGKRPAESGDVLLYMASDNAPITRLNVSIRMSIGFDLAEVPEREGAGETLVLMAGAVADALAAMEAA